MTQPHGRQQLGRSHGCVHPNAGRRGAAAVEAVVALPFMVLVFVCVLYVQRASLARQSADATARTCAWLYSANNCTHRPPGCEAVSFGDFEPPRTAFSPPNLETLMSGGSSKKSPSVFNELLGTILRHVLADRVREVFESGVSTTVHQPLEVPRVLGESAAAVTGRYHLACNLEPKTIGELLEEAWHVIWP